MLFRSDIKTAIELYEKVQDAYLQNGDDAGAEEMENIITSLRAQNESAEKEPAAEKAQEPVFPAIEEQQETGGETNG